MRILLILLLTVFYNFAYAGKITSKLIGVQNIYFMHFSGKEYKEIFRTPDDSKIYGYGLLSNNKALFAYQELRFAEAIATLVVVDAKTGKTIYKDGFGGAGETSFDFSKETGRAVFNDSEGLKIIQFTGRKVIITPIKEMKDNNPFAPFWVDSGTVGYFVYQDDKQIFKTITAP